MERTSEDDHEKIKRIFFFPFSFSFFVLNREVIPISCMASGVPKATVWVKNAAPMVGSWNSKNSSRTKRTTRQDLPTAESPSSTLKIRRYTYACMYIYYKLYYTYILQIIYTKYKYRHVFMVFCCNIFDDFRIGK